jgi:HNH endonuclease
MKQEISDFYKSKGFVVVYINTNKEPRRVATLRTSDGKMTSMAYAKYLYTSHYKCEIPEGFQVDHINNDKMDDRIENLQILDQKANNLKAAAMVELTCPVCGVKFEFKARNLKFKPEPCCSRKCGGIKSHWTKNKE